MTRLERLWARLVKAGEERDAALLPLIDISAKATSLRTAYERVRGLDPNNTLVLGALDDDAHDACAALNGAIAELEGKQKAMLRAQSEYDSALIAAHLGQDWKGVAAEARPKVFKLVKSDE